MSKIPISRIETFVEMMNKNDEQAQYGFALLIQRDDLLDFYEKIEKKDFFESSRIRTTEAYKYLQYSAIVASKKNDLGVLKKIITKLHDLTNKIVNDKSEEKKENYWLIFNKIFSEILPSALTNDDIKLVKKWLEKGTKRFMDFNIGRKLMPHLLTDPSSITHAYNLLKYLVTIVWLKHNFFKNKIPYFKIDDYSISELFKRNSVALGQKCGKEATQILIEQLKKIHAKEVCQGLEIESWTWLPAIEDHNQNIGKNETKPILVYALRDILIAFLDAKPNDFNLEKLINHELDIIVRIGIFLLDVKFVILQDQLSSLISKNFFHSSHLHEVYNFLKNHFPSLSTEVKITIFNEIKNITTVERSGTEEFKKRDLQKRYLHAIYNKGFPEADLLYNELNSQKDLAPISNHPDFYFYIESYGPSNNISVYSISELIDFANKNILSEKLMEFHDSNILGTPNIQGLVLTLEKSIRNSPEKFLISVHDFLALSRIYQYAFIHGFYTLWETTTEPDPYWSTIWEKLFTFFDALILSDFFWEEEEIKNGILIPTKNWIPPLIVDFLYISMQNDKKAFPETFLPQAIILIQKILSNVSSEENFTEYKEDAMLTAINDPKGKTIRALIIYALRKSRASDKETGEHVKSWKEVELLFNNELIKCKNANFSFSTLLGAYLENMCYLNTSWLKNNFDLIFPSTFLENMSCAIQGLAYSQASSMIVYSLLQEKKIFTQVIKKDISTNQGKEHLLKRAALGYLWGKETLDSDFFAYLIENKKTNELRIIIRYFWSIQHQELEKTMIDKILSFWKKCTMHFKTSSTGFEVFLSDLGILICYLDRINAQEKEWLLLSAPFMSLPQANNDFEYARNLDRLVDESPEEVLEVFEIQINHYLPVWDLGDYYRSLLTKLYRKPKLSYRVTILFDKLRRLPGFQELYEDIINKK